MKIIIDIPEERYKHIQEEQWLPNRLLIEKAIANGIPLDKIKAEIKARVFDLPKAPCERDYWFGASDAREIAFAVLDKYTKGDRE